MTAGHFAPQSSNKSYGRSSSASKARRPIEVESIGARSTCNQTGRRFMTLVSHVPPKKDLIFDSKVV